jgi:2-succinyl-5-enolpyruvyl-6-hydroxy-3-cyclohexene-1-carboxylate synthase
MGPYGQVWLAREMQVRDRLRTHLQGTDTLFESKLSWLLPSLLPPQTPLMIANSMPVRDMEWFWPLNDREIQPYFNRGANGIDGTLSTALGLAHHHRRAVLLTGDLALLHDSNGFLNARERDGHLTILLVNNQGGGIFEMLPIAQFEPPFERFFATPQAVDFGLLAAAHGIAYDRVSTWTDLETALAHWPERGVRLLEIRCDRTHDAQQRRLLLDELGRFTL